MDSASQYALAYALTTTAGVRGVLALAAASIAAHVGFLHPPLSLSWLGSATAMWSLIGVAAIDIAADKVPFLDHAMHIIGVTVKPAAGAILVAGTLHPPSQQMLIALMTLGALNTLGIHAAIALARGASTVSTGGIANPAISLGEDGVSICALILAFVAPVVAAFGAICFTIAIFLIGRFVYNHRPARVRNQ